MQTVADKLKKYCSYQERCLQEVRQKLATFKLPKSEVEAIIEELVEDGFVDEARFVECFIHGKMNIKKWGRMKLKNELVRRQISAALIAEKMETIDEELYTANLCSLIEKWHRENALADKAKLYRYLLSKGYESALINTYINK